MLHDIYFLSLENEKPNQSIRELIIQLRKLEPRIGYHFLIYLTAKIQNVQKENLDFDKLSRRNKLKKLKKSNPTQQKENQNGLQSLLNSIPMIDCYNPSSSSSSSSINNNNNNNNEQENHNKIIDNNNNNSSHNNKNESNSHHSINNYNSLYKSYLTCINNKKQAFWLDCKLCAETDPDSFFWMLPQLCNFIDFTHSSDFIHTLVLHIDPPQFSKVLGSLIRGSYHLLLNNNNNNSSTIYNILSKSLHWGSYEQSLLWQIVKAESSVNILIQFISPLLNDIKNPDKHGEALSGIVIALKDYVHSSLIKSVVTLPESFKLFPTDLLSYWFDLNSKETISALTDLCDLLCDPDTRDNDMVIT